MITNAKPQRLVKQVFYGLMLLILMGLIYGIIHRYAYIAPLSSKKALLSPITYSLLEGFTDPIEFTLYSPENDTYHEAALLIEQYQKKAPLIQFNWLQEDYHFSHKHIGEALDVRYQNQHYFIDLSNKKINEASVTQLLFKFKRHANAWVVFLQGHGEPDLFGKESRDYSLWRKALENQGLKIQALTLTQTPIITDNTQLLIMSSLQSDLFPQEHALISQYISKGGNVLWLMDPTSKRLDFLEKQFGVQPLPGTIVDLHGQQLGTPHPAITLIEHYPNLPFSAPTLLSAYPWSVALQSQKSDWTVQPLLITDEATWTETGPLTGEIELNTDKGEHAGPLLLGLSLTRAHPQIPEQQQRIAIIGNSRFISNGVIENYGNLAFGQNLISWLNQDDQLIAIEQPVSTDSFAYIHLMTASLIQFGFPGLGLIIMACSLLYGIRRFRMSQRYSAWIARE